MDSLSFLCVLKSQTLIFIFLYHEKEIGDMGHLPADLKLEKKPVPADNESDSDDSEVMNSTSSFLRGKKRGLNNFKNSFFSGCTPIREEH